MRLVAPARTPGSPHSSRSYHRWLQLLGVWLIYFSFGVIATSMAPLIPLISGDLGIDYARMGFILGAWPLIYLFAALPSGMILDRFSARKTLLIAALIVGASGLARAVAQDEASMFLAVALFGIGGPLISVGAPKLIAQLFEGPVRGTAMGIYMTGPTLGTAASLAFTNSVMMPLMGHDWRMVMLSYGILAIGSGVFWFLVAGRIDSHPTPSAERSKPGAGVMKILSIPVVQIILVISVGIFFVNHGLNNWLPEMLRANGLDAKMAGYVASLPTLIGIAGSLLIPRLAIPARRLAILFSLFFVITVTALLLSSSLMPVLLIALIATGIARGAVMPVVTLVLLETSGVDKTRHGAAIGLFFAAGEVGGVLGPVTIGVLSTQSGNFTSSVFALAIIGAIMASLAAVLYWLQQKAARTENHHAAPGD